MKTYLRPNQIGTNIENRVFVARTTDPRQRSLDAFVINFGRALHTEGQIKRASSLHLTFVASFGGIRRVIEETGLVDFCKELEADIGKAIPSREISVSVNSDIPLGAYGIHEDVVGVNLVATQQLKDQRAIIDAFLQEKFGITPDDKEFNPHISLGFVSGHALELLTRDPMLLLPEGLSVPGKVSLNGLEAYIGNIHAKDQLVA